MANVKPIQQLKFGADTFAASCWEQLGLTQAYMLALLGRDEYTPVAAKQPSGTDTLYTDPVSGNLAGIHAGQCVIYPDSEMEDGWGLSIAKYVESGSDGVPTTVCWFHATELQKKIASLTTKIEMYQDGSFGTGLWVNEYPYQNEACWENGE